ncbi:Protein transport protein Sec23A [Tritrichomonas musculus]|uniref:Protein transport protein SEC23 n=1 Tax=Tritrichomonas musculus TaxID=1915356 RepID=A0ABR2K7Q5_9EUKA
MDFNQVEDLNGIRFTWNVLPTNRVDANNCALPIGCLYTPLKQIPDHQPVPYQPVTCQRCRCVLNPYCSLDLNNKTWLCPICKGVSPLPASYHCMTQDCLAAEMLTNYTTIEYTINSQTEFPPVFLFVVDTCLSEKEHQALKTLLLQAIGTLPPTSLVGFISYGKLVYVHELKFSECPRNFVFNGVKTYDVLKLKQYLSLNTATPTANNFILPISEAEQMLNTIIDTLEVDPFIVERGNRFERCTGAALDIAVTLLESIFPKMSSQVFLFTGGPITRGPGTMAEIKRSEIVRQHNDIETGKAELSKKSKEFFAAMADKASSNNIVVNYIGASFEETGLYEVHPVIYKTGGFLLSNESFAEENISKTLIKYFKGGIFHNSGADATIIYNASPNLKISGCVGPCASLNVGSPLVSLTSPSTIGEGNTIEWKICGLLPTTTFGFIFDITNPKTSPIGLNEIGYVQFSTKYMHISTGEIRLRVTTTAVRFADLTSNKDLLVQGFDQEAATILFAKSMMWKIQSVSSNQTISSLVTTNEIIQNIDRKLISFCKLFAAYKQRDTSSFTLDPQLQYLPQFIYHFRRSPFLSTFNSSPDQTASLRHSLLTEDVTNSLFMIQPTLMCFSLNAPPTPVLLDSNSLRQDVVLLLDTYFRILIWHGSTIAAWRNQGYQDQEEYQNLKAALEQPKEEAMQLLNERFPTPQFASCDQDSSLSRYLLSRCNPSSDVSFTTAYGPADNLSTDEPSLSKFMQKLKEMTISS